MIEFKVLKKSKLSRARIGNINGVVETPCLVLVATQAVIKTMTSEEARETKTNIIIANAFHLHLKPGEKIVQKAGGLHKFMNWKGMLMTDSGGFQVFSLGFGRDLGVGKIAERRDSLVKESSQPKFVKITDDGAYFSSPVDGKKLFLGPKESIKIQEALGADIIFAFDECTPPNASFKYIRNSLDRTHKWAKMCINNKKSNQSLFGIIQGSKFKELRKESAELISSLSFDGFGIGGDLGDSIKSTKDILNWTIPLLDESKPRHLLGIGHLKDIETIIKNGVDLFDCTVPTHYARRGIAFISSGKLNLKQSIYLKDRNPLDKKCKCFVCDNYRRNYISHLIRAKEITALKLLTFHNLYFFNSYIEGIRERIKSGKI